LQSYWHIRICLNELRLDSNPFLTFSADPNYRILNPKPLLFMQMTWQLGRIKE
jgi:hypothetical protein